jgi:translation elongation factor EF-1alpha
MEEVEVGEVFDYFARVEVAAVKVTGRFKVGDSIRIKGATTDFMQQVGSMQIHNKAVEEAKPGDDIGIKVIERVRKHDKVYAVEV